MSTQSTINWSGNSATNPRLRPAEFGWHIGVLEPPFSPDQPDDIGVNGHRYIRCCTLAKKVKKKRTSVAWYYGEDIKPVGELKPVAYWYCYLCEKENRKQELPQVSNGTDTALSHLETKHKIHRETGKKIEPLPKEPQQPTMEQHRELVTVRIFDQFKLLLIRWLVYCHIAFFQFENGYFRELLTFLYPSLNSLIPKAGRTIKGWVIDEFRSRKEDLKLEMSTAVTNIHISFDLWTSPNSKAVLAIVAHFIDRIGKRRTALLALREVEGTHSGANIAKVMLAVFKDYCIRQKIGFFMADNADTNDTCLDIVLQKLNPWMTRKQRLRRRLRCFGYIVNLCAQAFLIGKDAEKICSKIDYHTREGDWKALGDLWRKRGAIGRLHNVVRYIRMTPQRRAEFKRITIGGNLAEFDRLELIQDNATRWNSFFTAIGRALNIRERIDRFCDSHVPTKGTKGVDKDRLHDCHWKQLQHLHDQLETFYEATVEIEGRKSYLYEHFLSLDWLLQEIERARQKYEELSEERLNRLHKKDYKWLAGCAEVAWNKCEKYYNKTGDSAAYFSSVVLNPTYKMAWFNEAWFHHPEKAHWLKPTQQQIKNLWLEEYKGRYSKTTTYKGDDNSPSPRVAVSAVSAANAFTSLKAHKRLKLAHPTDSLPQEVDDFDQYLETNRVEFDGSDHERFDCISYWMDRRQSTPDLARFALDMLAIPPMSDETERVFSAAKILLNDRRSRLKINIIEANECLRHWFGPPPKGTFEQANIGYEQGEEGHSRQKRNSIQYDDQEQESEDGDDDIRDDELEGIDMGFLPGESIDISENEDD